MDKQLLLVDPAKLASLIEKQPEQYQSYLHERWLHMALWWDSRSTKAKRAYLWLRRVVVGGGVLIPVLTAMHAVFEHDAVVDRYAPLVSIALAFVGACVAGAAAWDGVQNYGEVWREKRRAAEMLKIEGWLFMTRSGKYARKPDTPEIFAMFVAQVEAIIAKEVGEYLKSIDSGENGKPG